MYNYIYILLLFHKKMADENQYTNPQNQWTTQTQNDNNDFDIFGWNDDVFENPDLLQIENWGIPSNNNDFDDDIDVDYRSETTKWIQWSTNTTQNIPEWPVFDEPDRPEDYISPDDENTSTITEQSSTAQTYDDDDFDIPILDIDENDNRDDDIFEENPKENQPQPTNTTTDTNNTNTTNTPDFDDDDIDDDFDDDDIDDDDFDDDDEDDGDIDDDIEGDNDFDDNINDNSINEPNENNNKNENSQNTPQPQTEPIPQSPVQKKQIPETIPTQENSVNTKNQETQTNTAENIIEKYENDSTKSYVQNKFLELEFETKKIFDLVKKDYTVWFDLLWANDDRQKITYKIFLNGNTIDIKKNNFDKINEATQENSLTFKLENDLNIFINGELLYNESSDLKNDENKNKQVIEKFNKFIFLITQEYKKIFKEKKAKEKENIKKTVFREF